MLELKKEILKLINSYDLPIDAVVFLTKDIYRDALDAYEELKMREAASANETPPAESEETNDN